MISPKNTRWYSHSMYAAPSTMPEAATTAHAVDRLKAPMRMSSSPTKPLRVGRPIEAMVMIMNSIAYTGMTLARPP